MKFRRMGSRRTLPPPFTRWRTVERGSILVYIIMVMVIFAVLGTAMVSLFSTSISSSATANESRRALYLYESGMRYGMSELLANDFSKTAISRLNTTNYKLGAEGSFSLNIFSPCFEAKASNEWTTGQTLPLDFAEGKAPSDFSVPTSSPYLSLVNFDYFGTTIPPSAIASIDTPIVSGDRKSVLFQVRDDLVANNNELICIAAHPSQNQSIVKYGWSIYIEPSAKELFPKANGAVVIKGKTYYYKDLLFESNNNRVVLTDLKGKSADFPFGMIDTDLVILSPDNHFVIPTGRFGDTVTEGDIKSSVSIYDPNPLKPKSRKPDIAFSDEPNLESVLNQVEPGGNSGFITVDNTNKRLTIGEGSGYLGAVWFNDTRNIGSVKNFCTNGACRFDDGFRAFFTIEYTGTGDGLVFALINGNASKNSNRSIGGEKDYPELLGYAGDGRLDAGGTSYPTEAPLPPQHGIIPPKIGLEFDTKVNVNSTFEQTVQYCTPSTSAGTLSTDTRNDPMPFNQSRDAIQYVFWGGSSLEIPCRQNSALYDDNRHDATGSPTSNWVLPTGNQIESSPAVTPDGRTIYVGSWDGSLYAFEAIGNAEMVSKVIWPGIFPHNCQ